MKNIILLIAFTLLLVVNNSEAKADDLTKLIGFYCSEWVLFGNNKQCFCYIFLNESEYEIVSGGAKHNAPIKSLKPLPYRIESGNVHLTRSDGITDTFKLESSEKFTTSDGRLEFAKRIDLPEFCRD